MTNEQHVHAAYKPPWYGYVTFRTDRFRNRRVVKRIVQLSARPALSRSYDVSIRLSLRCALCM